MIYIMDLLLFLNKCSNNCYVKIYDFDTDLWDYTLHIKGKRRSILRKLDYEYLHNRIQSFEFYITSKNNICISIYLV